MTTAAANIEGRVAAAGKPSGPAFEVYLTFIRTAFLKMLAYRLRYYTGILTYLLFVSVHYFIWQAVFRAHGGGEINGYTFTQMVTYVAIGWITRSFYFSNTDEEIDDLVRTGQIGIYLLRPVDLQLMMLSQAAGDCMFRLLFFAPPIAVVTLLVFPVSLPPSWTDALLFALATAVGFLVLALINFIIGMFAFWFKSIDGLIRAKYYIVQLFSGLLIPVAFFPGWLGRIVDALPLKMIAFVPLQFYLGKVPHDRAWLMLTEQLAWVLALVVSGRILWRIVLRKLTIQGG